MFCVHLYTEPKQLPCLHIFCLECLNNLATLPKARLNDLLFAKKSWQIVGHLILPWKALPNSSSGRMEALPSCFYVKNLLDILAIRECNTSKVACGNSGEKRDEISCCFYCCKFWCKDCLNAHNILKENREHRFLSLKDFQD